ncbi:MAG: hypothetical protein JXR37_32370 [Kiritimatiellae bacterium]|nr:hypothetical protein [Kiritimatiellia bacterium]
MAFDWDAVPANMVGVLTGLTQAIGPGVCVPWPQKRAELPARLEGEDLLRDIWAKVDALGNTFIWRCLVWF